ncbi:MAG: hypothetical protein IKI56_05760 [Ruminococcus sp.]|nr:hypothetical protein [Ruminococcus sp.]MCR5075258.1 hypothetical protein [Ruminococcus sp.]HRR75979.1 hypothetical protein [Ruminococcus sp.]
MNKKDFIIPDPDFEEFDGIFVGSKDGTTLPPNNIDFSKIIPYMKVNKKSISDLSPEEIEMFKFKD